MADTVTGAELTEGERWSREQLAALLEGRFSPASIGRFLLASQLRANAVRSDRPDLARQAWTWMAAGGGAWLILAGAGAQPFRRRWRGGLAWWAATAVMLDWHLGMVETPDGRPCGLGPADAVTLLRAWLVPDARGPRESAGTSRAWSMPASPPRRCMPQGDASSSHARWSLASWPGSPRG